MHKLWSVKTLIEFTDEDVATLQKEAVKHQELAKFIANGIFKTPDLKVGYTVIAKFASEGYFIVKEDELKDD